ncbi:signal recognition particle-docking protein FtsY [Candidatus Pelagadaptatus aseana]|uniref:signal recognition particle-docking protein FtsY n=1 Tax=Candidatus Pelagadaptatus aseana TaxID=3120508 RepID=UPI003C6EF2E6
MSTQPVTPQDNTPAELPVWDELLQHIVSATGWSEDVALLALGLGGLVALLLLLWLVRIVFGGTQTDRESAETTPSAAEQDEPELALQEPVAASETSPEPEPEPEISEQGLFARLKAGLSRTNANFAEGLGNLFMGQKEIDEDLLEEIETQLLVADVGMDATTEIIDMLTERVERKQLADADALYKALQEALAELLHKVESPLQLPEKQPAVVLVVGVNGVGKTTTIGKLAKRLQRDGKSVMLAAGDTFRAAAVEQLQVWGERNQVPVVAQHTGADSASVIFDAIASGQAKGTDVIIADTAGRLHNKGHLMEELAKVKRVMAKLDDTAPHEVLLVLDAGTGQNALSQAEQFIEAAGVTGLVLTKLDGTAKGGVIFALSKRFGLPVRFIGVGEGIDDLRPFVAEDFVQALFGND